MDAGRAYQTQVALVTTLVILSIVAAAALTAAGVAQRVSASRLVLVEASVVSIDHGRLQVRYDDAQGRAQSAITDLSPGLGERVGTQLELTYPPGQPLRLTRVPNADGYFLAAAGALLVGPALWVHLTRTRQRRDLARAPVNLQPVEVEVRTSTRASRNNVVPTTLALLTFPGRPYADAQVALSSVGSKPPPGRYAGEVAGELKHNGIVVLWIGGAPVQVGGNLRRA